MERVASAYMSKDKPQVEDEESTEGQKQDKRGVKPKEVSDVED
jgi:hypothetical protein